MQFESAGHSLERLQTCHPVTLSRLVCVYEEKKTYLPIPWEIGDLKDIVEYVGSGAESVLEIAKRAQERFVYYAENRDGRKDFVSHVNSVLLAN